MQTVLIIQVHVCAHSLSVINDVHM